MKVTTKLTVLALTTFLLGSCNTTIVCREIRSAVPKAMPLCDVSFKFNECFCRCFNLSKFDTVTDKTCNIYPKYVPTKTPNNFYSIAKKPSGFVYLKFTGGAYPLNTCDKLSGFFVNQWAKEIAPKIKRLDRVKRDNCK